jgi:hypothetical protein
MELGRDEKGWDMYVFRVERLFSPWHALQKNWDVRFAFEKCSTKIVR